MAKTSYRKHKRLLIEASKPRPLVKSTVQRVSETYTVTSAASKISKTSSTTSTAGTNIPGRNKRF